MVASQVESLKPPPLADSPAVLFPETVLLVNVTGPKNDETPPPEDSLPSVLFPETVLLDNATEPLE